jgi:DNA-binding transcriptional LysR family regulator
MHVALEIRHCRALIAVADEGGIARAAANLGVAQSTLSETLISLERAVGARLVLRQRGVEARLTQAAQILLPHARRITAAAQAAMAEVAAQSNILRVGAVESISSYFLPTAIHSLRNSHPQVRVQVTAGLCASLMSNVKSGDLDIAILLRDVQSRPVKNLVMRPLGTTRLRMVVKRGGPLSGRRLGSAELAHCGVVVPDPQGPLNDLLETWFKASGAASRLVSAGSLDAVRRSVVADGAVGLLPAYAADPEIATGALIEADLEFALPALALNAATATSSVHSAALETLIDCITREVRSLAAV